MDKNLLKTRITESTGMPKDVLLGIPYLSVTGRNEVRIENFRGIIEYNDHIIRVQTKNGKINVCGQNLLIQTYADNEMIITGCIGNIELFEV